MYLFIILFMLFVMDGGRTNSVHVSRISDTIHNMNFENCKEVLIVRYKMPLVLYEELPLEGHFGCHGVLISLRSQYRKNKLK